MKSQNESKTKENGIFICATSFKLYNKTYLFCFLDFLLVIQTPFMMHLMELYNHMLQLDATYKIVKYAVPAWQLVVETNVGYQVLSRPAEQEYNDLQFQLIYTKNQLIINFITTLNSSQWRSSSLKMKTKRVFQKLSK